MSTPLSDGAESRAAAEAFARAVQMRASGNQREAAAASLMAFALAPQVSAYRSAAFETLNLMAGYRTLPQPVMAALVECARDPALDIQPLSLVVRNLTDADPRLPELIQALAGEDGPREAAVSHSGWLLDDALLQAVLARAVNISVMIETMCTALRRHLCARVAANQATLLLTRHRDFLIALTQQCITNRYAWAESALETAALTTLASRSDEAALLLRAAYRPLREIAADQAHYLPKPLADHWRDETDERRRAAALPALTPISPGLSAAMQDQYETYPYPRWRHVHVEGRRSLRDLLTNAMPHVSFAPELAGKVDVLVAGCGTGQPALTLALGLTNAQIHAIDISRTSLAYAARMASVHGADNIEFGVADILNLDQRTQRYDFIDCSGVLHHMADPGAGLGVLRRLLCPHGVMMVALYSARGRTGEVAAQAFVRERGFADTPQGLRTARAALLDLPPAHPARAVVDTPDFFTVDGLHDLIFNIHESRTSPGAMKNLLAAHGLTAIGVEVPPALGGDAFKVIHPDPAAWADLDLWEAFEAEHPTVFAHMIRVWCRPAP